MATQTPPPSKPGKQGNGGQTEHPTEVELLKVVVTREGQKVNAQWGLHPQIKHDLLPEEWKEVSDLMAKLTTLVGSRFAEILAQAEPDKPGTA
jgi:hypothetical protein